MMEKSINFTQIGWTTFFFLFENVFVFENKNEKNILVFFFVFTLLLFMSTTIVKVHFYKELVINLSGMAFFSRSLTDESLHFNLIIGTTNFELGLADIITKKNFVNKKLSILFLKLYNVII